MVGVPGAAHVYFMPGKLFIALLLTGCAVRAEGRDAPADSGTVDSAVVDTSPSSTPMDGGFVVDALAETTADTATACKDEPPSTGSAVMTTMAADYGAFYKSYDLGPVPGMPTGHLGGCILKDDNTLLLAGDSESPSGGLYSIKVKRGPCGHIVGWDGSAAKVADAPYIDANILALPASTLLYSQWPQNKLGMLTSGATSPSKEVDLAPVGVDSSIGGLGFVPKGYAAEGELRGVTWSLGNWFHLALKPEGALYNVTTATKKVTLPNGPGGFAYVPAGSPGFPKNRLILSEWSADSVATYEVDGEGDPIVETRKAFFESFPKPWGAYFDPKTGDFVFLTWGSPPDRVFVVQGFSKPPPPPPAPK